MRTPRPPADIHHDDGPKVAHLAPGDTTTALCGATIEGRLPTPADGDWRRCSECARIRFDGCGREDIA
jgi:hypothetical protein